MAESLSSQPADAPHDADAVARKQFEVTRRGFDQNQVRAYLYSVASTIRAGERREAELRDRVAAAVRRAHDAEKLDETALTERLGEETVRVLTTAREAADAKVAKATADADGLLDAARVDAAEIREQADSILEARSAEAEIAAEAIREEALAELVKAQELAVAEIEAGKVAAAELITEGQAVREEVLRDMSKRRQQAKAQVERLRAGRDRLMGTFDTVQEALDDVRTGVKNSLGEAKVSADMAARRVLDERPPALDELEAEVETARMLGLATPTLPTEEADSSAEPSDEADSSADGGKDSSEGSEEADSSADGGEDSAEGSHEPDEPETEPRAIELDPEVRAGKKLRDQPEVEGDELLTVVMDDPVEAVEVKTDEPAEEAEEADSSADGDEDFAEGSDEPEPDVDDLFARLRGEQDQAEEDADVDAGDLFDESEPAAEDSAAPEAKAGDSSDSAGLFDESEPDADESDAADDAEAPDDAAVLDEVVAALVSTAERRLKRVLADDQNRVLAGLRPKGKGKRRGAPPDQLDLDTQIDLYLEAVSAQMDARAEQGGADDMAAARAVLADSLVAPLREAVDAAIESNADPDDRVSAVRAVYRERKVGMGEVAAELIG